MERPLDDDFKQAGEEMLACFREGKVDYNTNFDCPYEWGSMQAGAWAAGYAKAMEEDDGQS